MSENLKKHRYQFERISVGNVNPRIKKTLENIAKNKGLSVSQLIRKRLSQIAKESTELDKVEHKKTSRLEVTGVNPKSKVIWNNIAKSKGLNLSQLVKIESYNIVNEATDREKRTYID